MKEIFKTLADKASTFAQASALAVGDLNGDGKVDGEDLKIAVAKAKNVGAAAAGEVADLAKATMKHELVKDAAAGAAVGACIVAPIPLVGLPAGAVVGATIGLVSGAIKKR